MAKRGQSQADIARAAGVSRQAVSLWFASERDFQNVHVATLMKLSDSLEIDPAEFLEPLPGMDDPAAVRRLATEFCWDRAYRGHLSVSGRAGGCRAARDGTVHREPRDLCGGVGARPTDMG